MSHFCVAVITKTKSNSAIAQAMKPFKEYDGETDFPKSLLEFHDETPEYKENYNTKSTDRILLPNGKYISTTEDILKSFVPKEEYDAWQGEKGTTWSDDTKEFYIYDYNLVGGKLVEVPYKELYKNFKDYVEAEEFSDWDPKQKAYGYWHNPNGKWDSYGVCNRGSYGRWQFADAEDACWKVSEFPLEGSEEAKKEAAETWEKEVVRSEGFYRPEYYTSRYKDKEEYVKRASRNIPWAMIVDGKWAERGEMGWWAMSDATNESERAFEEYFEKSITDPKYKDYYICMCNCHI